MSVKRSVDNEKKPVGRPKKYEDESDALKRRNITVTDTGWNGLDEIVGDSKLVSSKSELVEQIGRNNFKVLSQKELQDLTNAEEIPVLSRLRSLTKKTAYMRSIISFVRLVMLRTGMSKEIDYDNDKLIVEVIVEAITSIALRDYVYPGDIVTSALADTRWLVFRILLLKSGKILGEMSDLKVRELRGNGSLNLNPEINRIFNSIYFFSISFASEYQVYEMRMIESLSWEQIHRLLKLRGTNLTEDELRNKNHEAVGKIREAWHSIDVKEMGNCPDESQLKKEMKISLALAQQYFELINSENKFSLNHFQQWECFLLKSMKQAKLDLLLPEIHHSWVHKEISDENREIYKERGSDIMDNVSDQFEKRLHAQLEKLKLKLKFCGNKRKDIQDVLMDVISLDIPEKHFLGDRCNLSEL